MSFQDFKDWLANNWRKKLFWTLVVVAISVMPYVLGWLVIDYQYNQRVKKLRSKGYPTNLEELDLWYTHVPEDENIAVPLQKAFSKLSTPEAVALADVTEKEISYEDAYKRRIINKKKKKAFAGKVIIAGDVRPGLYLGIGLPEDIKVASGKFLEANQTGLDEINKALKRPKCRYPVDFKLGFNTLLPHLSQIRQSARILAVQAILAAEDDNLDLSISSIKSGFRLADTLNNEPIAISHLVGIAIRGIMCEVIEWLMNSKELSIKQLDELDCLLKKQNLAKGAIKSFIGETVLLQDDQLLDELFKKQFIYLGNAGATPAVIESFNVFISKISGIKKINKIAVLDFTLLSSEYLENEEIDFFEFQKTVSGKIDREIKKYVSINWLVAPSMGGKKAQTTISLCRTMIGVEKYRVKYKKLPDSLDQLVPEFMTAIPIDPFDGKPIKYRKGKIDKKRHVTADNKGTGKDEKISQGFGFGSMFGPSVPKGIKEIISQYPGYVIYSVGRDGIDNNGKEYASQHGPNRIDITFTVIRQDKK